MKETHCNFLFDLDQTLLDFHASEHKALGIVLARIYRLVRGFFR